MWIPKTVYERVPHFWMLIGILFVISAVFFGFDFPLSLAYLGIGLLCVVWSGCVIVLRTRRNKRTAEQAQSAEQVH